MLETRWHESKAPDDHIAPSQKDVYGRWGFTVACKPCRVVNMAAGSEADAAGLLANDCVIEINGCDVRDASEQDVLSILRLRE